MSLRGALVLAGLMLAGAAPCAAATATVTVTGTVNEAASVQVNSVAAAVLGTTFTAANVPLDLGTNTITVVAIDAAGNRTQASISVIVKKRFTITGTVNEPTSAMAVNGITASVSGSAFSADVPLTRGVNTIQVTATDTAGNVGTASIEIFVARTPVDHP